MPPDLITRLKDPLKFARFFWPDVSFYKQQRDIIYSVAEDDETYVPAGNMLGKDFVAGFIALWFFLSREPVRVVTTSADYSQLESVLWGEIRRFIQTSKYPLAYDKGGPLIINHLHVRKALEGKVSPLSYLLGRVAAKGEGMLGHHIADVGDGVPRTLFIADEASGAEEASYERASTWARRMLIIGNTYPPQNKFFKQGVKGGNLRAATNGHYHRKVIRIKATDSPNVIVGEAMAARGEDVSRAPSVVPGVLPYADYLKRRATWDKVRQCIGLDAEFYEGAENLLFPPDWLNRAERIASSIQGNPRKAKAIGIDPAEGGDKTAMAAVDELGLIELVSKRTPDTSVITGEALAFMRRHGVEPEKVVFDRGGGGKEHADRLRAQGYNVRTVAFGESLTLDPKRGLTLVEERLDNKEERYVYRNRRTEMYGRLHCLLDPAAEGLGFAIPQEYRELRDQLCVMPLMYDGEGRLTMLPKNKPNPDSPTKTLVELIGHSPDEADALVLAVHGMMTKTRRAVAGAML